MTTNAQATDALWRPFTQHAVPQTPMVMTEARGSTIIDAEGNEYIDAMAGLWCVNAGYGQERLVEAAANQMRQLPYTPLTRPAPAAIDLAERLTALLPGDLNHVVFVNSGSEAVETALKLARQYARLRFPQDNRYKIISRYRGYHGWTMGALGATGQEVRKTRFEPLVGGHIHVRPPDLFRIFADLTPSQAAAQLLRELEDVILFEGPETIAAFIGEPIIGGGGIIVPPDEYWPGIRELCDRYGILLIHDEVITGFGRTGRWFGCEQWGVVPDIMTMAKGITSGYIPLGATAVTEQVFDTFKGAPADNVQFNQLSTYGGHPVACAVAVANLAVLAEDKLVENSERMGALLGDGLRELLADHPIVGHVRGKGLLWGVELAVPGTTTPLAGEHVNAVMREAQARGVLLGKNSATVRDLDCTLTISPPLVINQREVEQLVSALDEALGTIRL